MNVKLMESLFKEYMDFDDTHLFTLWGIASEIHAGGEEYKRAEILNLIRKLLSEKYMIVGDFDSDGTYVEWTGTPDELVLKIDDCWRSLPGKLDLGDVCYFRKIT